MSGLLVLGVGNILRADDGLGVLAVRELLRESWPPEVTLLDGGTFTQDMPDAFQHAAKLLVLDAVRAGGVPGDMRLFSRKDLLADDGPVRLSLHEVGLLDALNMAELRFRRSIEMEVLGLEPFDTESWCIGLSPSLRSPFKRYLDETRRVIRAHLAAFGNPEHDFP